MLNNKIKLKSGFTIIETMVSVSIFIIIVMAGMTALLNANLVHNVSQNMSSIMDNLNFVMDDMTKNLREGDTYDCINDIPSSVVATSGEDCKGIAFKSGNDDGTINYFVYYLDDSSSGSYQIWRYSSNNIAGINDITNYTQMTSGDQLSIKNYQNVFSVLGAAKPILNAGTYTGDLQQPLVTIKLAGSIKYKNTETPFSLQTSVSQRSKDN